jgi:sucrose-6F-phosphate phosphohydrolase
VDRRNLVVSDVDGTLLGDDAALAELRRWYDERRDALTLVYSSGRFYHSVLESIRTTLLPEPAAVIGGVGTDVHFFGEEVPLRAWHDGFEGWDPPGVRAVLAAYRELVPQPEHLQSDYKLSYYGHDLSPAFIEHLQTQLQYRGYQVHVVYSSQRDLDVLPHGANKGTAAVFIAEQLGFRGEDVIVCGDSGNDLAMFEQPAVRGVVVANAHAELKALRSERVYHAARSYAGGVLEGLRHWCDQ